jgi:hypothetical protein
MLAAMVVGGLSFLALPLTVDYTAALACAFGVGVMEGIVVFHILYYANVDRHTQARSAAWVESIAGIGFTFGPLIFGLLTWNTAGALTFRPYLPGTLAVLVTASAVAVLWARRWRAEDGDGRTPHNVAQTAPDGIRTGRPG